MPQLRLLSLNREDVVFSGLDIEKAPSCSGRLLEPESFATISFTSFNQLNGVIPRCAIRRHPTRCILRRGRRRDPSWTDKNRPAAHSVPIRCSSRLGTELMRTCRTLQRYHAKVGLNSLLLARTTVNLKSQDSGELSATVHRRAPVSCLLIVRSKTVSMRARINQVPQGYKKATFHR